MHQRIIEQRYSIHTYWAWLRVHSGKHLNLKMVLGRKWNVYVQFRILTESSFSCMFWVSTVNKVSSTSPRSDWQQDKISLFHKTHTRIQYNSRTKNYCVLHPWSEVLIPILLLEDFSWAARDFQASFYRTFQKALTREDTALDRCEPLSN